MMKINGMNQGESSKPCSAARSGEPARPAGGLHPNFSSAKAEREGGLKLFFLFMLVCYLSNAQNLDSLYNAFITLRGIENESTARVMVNNTEVTKCSFSLIASVYANYNNFSPKQKVVLSTLFARPPLETSIVSSSGRFRIHYDKTGKNAPAYDVNELARAVDSAYNYEVNILKYPPQPGDGIAGGDEKYDIYIENQTSGEYGATYPEENLTNQTYTNYIKIDNDFSGISYNTHGIDAARATVAHELHHAIQIGNYIYPPKDSFFHESTSTAMEEFVFDDVNDYYFYIHTYTDNPGKTITLYWGYNLALWNIFLKDNYGIDIIKRIWELMRTKRAVESFEIALGEKGSSFKEAYNLFGLWMFFTNTRAVKGKYFEEADQFPANTKINPLMSTTFNKPTTTIMVTSQPASNCYIEFTSDGSIFTAIITNADIQSSISNTSSRIIFNYELSSGGGSGFRKLANGYYSRITGDNLSFLLERDILNNIPLNEGPMPIETTAYAYPQPFSYSKHTTLKLPASLSGSTMAEVKIYSVDMNLVYSSNLSIVGSDKIVVAWNGLANSGKKLPTGVYLYFVKCGDEIIKGKFVIHNE